MVLISLDAQSPRNSTWKLEDDIMTKVYVSFFMIRHVHFI